MRCNLFFTCFQPILICPNRHHKQRFRHGILKLNNVFVWLFFNFSSYFNCLSLIHSSISMNVSDEERFSKMMKMSLSDAISKKKLYAVDYTTVLRNVICKNGMVRSHLNFSFTYLKEMSKPNVLFYFFPVC